MAVLFSAAMSFVTYGVYESQWWWSVCGIGLLVVFVAAGGFLVPSATRALSDGDAPSGNALLQAFGAFCVTELFTMGLVSWCIGNRSFAGNNAYQALGLVIFLGLLGVGAQGVVATLARFIYVRNRDSNGVHAPAHR
jgi:hypothetical protein